MRTKYAIIEIKSAKFVCDKNPDDYIFHHQDYIPRKRTEDQNVTIPEKETDLITKHQVSAMLHAMLGSRPVSYIHGSLYSSSDEINELANNSLIRADNTFCYVQSTQKGDINRVVSELTQSRKSHYRSRKKSKTLCENGDILNGKFTWDSMKRRLMFKTHKNGENMYTYIMNYFHSVCPDETLFEKHELVDFLRILSQDEVIKNKLITFFNDDIKQPKTAFISILTGIPCSEGLEGDVNGNWNSTEYNLAAQTLTKSIKRKITLDATIMIPVTNDVARTFVTSKRFATFGDNGVAILKGIESHNEDDLIYKKGFTNIYKN